MGRRPLQTFRLYDGRRLKYVIDGPAHALVRVGDNKPLSLPVIFAFHAMFLSGKSFLQQASPSDYVVVCINRPGYHGSSPVTVGEYSYSNFAADVQELADHLGIDQFFVAGHSSGGPNALACASFLKERVLGVAIMAGDPEYAEERNTKTTKSDDNQHGEGHGALSIQQSTVETKQESSRHDDSNTTWTDWFLGCCLPNFMRFVPFIDVTNGLKNDFYMEREKYPFRTEDICQPAIVVLGDQDMILPNEVAVKVHHRLPNTQLIMLEGVGHNQFLEDDILDMIFRRTIDLASKNPGDNSTTVEELKDRVEQQQIETGQDQSLHEENHTRNQKDDTGTITAPREMEMPPSTSLAQSSCWKCHGHGKKYEKATKSYTGKNCTVCDGLGTRPASQKSQEQSQQPGYIQFLRGYPDHHPLRRVFPDKFAHPRAFQSLGGNIPEHLLPQVGEIVASLGCGDWRLYQIQNGNKLTVDDFICAYVAAQEMLRRGWTPPRSVSTSHGDALLGGLSVQDASNSRTSPTFFTHADLGTGCGSVLMMLAWAFQGQVRSVGVEAQDVSFHCLKRGVEWNTGSNGSQPRDLIRIQQGDLRTWEGDAIRRPPYQLITGTPPYFPLDSFVASQNHEQKIRCRIPTRGGASDYIRTASRLLKEQAIGDNVSSAGVFCMVEASFERASETVQQSARECGMKIERRLDVVTREGLPPRFSCWVMTKPHVTLGDADTVRDDSKASFPIEMLTLRNADLLRTEEYSAAMECMGWVDFESHGKDRDNG